MNANKNKPMQKQVELLKNCFSIHERTVNKFLKVFPFIVFLLHFFSLINMIFLVDAFTAKVN